MRNHFALALLFVCFLWAVSAQAGVDQVILYPDGAEVTQTETARVEEKNPGYSHAVLYLPASAHADSLRILEVQRTEARLQGVSHRQVRSTNREHIAKLRQRIEELREEQNEVQATLAGVTARIDLWHNAVRAVSSSQEEIQTQNLYDLSSTLAQALPSLMRDKTDKDNKIAELETRIKDLKDELEKSIEKPDAQLEVRLQLEGSGLEVDQVLPVTVSYLLPDSRWRPAYTLEAQPEQDRIDFQWRAVVTQKSGLVWKDVHLLLSTGRMHQRVNPPQLPDWIIQPRPQPRPLSAQDRANVNSQELALRTSQAPNGAARTQHATFDLWDAGRQTIRPGQEQQVHISKDSWPAEFQRILRPAVDNRAFLTAKTKTKQAQNIPPGQAMLLVQGRMAGKTQFAFSGQQKELAFGTDPQVTARRIMERKQEGEQGILKNKQKLNWHYRFDVVNGKNDPVRVRLEETQPVSRHEDITIDLASPGHEFQIKDNTVYWDLSLQPGEKLSVPLQVTVTAPRDMELSSSR
ncbi:MAG: mucoidy inhibitor MuiA family protein [Desulfovermiculus sp.]